MTVCQCSMYFLGWFIVACCCVVRFSDCYVGVERYSNGTDLEIHRSNKDASGDITTCGESQVLGEKYIIVDDLHCGYVCSEQRSSSYRKRAVGLSCFADERIRKNEPCYHGSIGKKYSSTEEIQILSVDELKTEKSIFYKDKRASKCKLNGGCSSIQYRNITSGWQATSLSGCFHISMDDSNVSVAVAEIKVSCSSAEMKQLEGLMFKMQMSCRIDEENKSYNTCFLFKLQGRYLEDESKSLYKSCAVVPTLATTSLSPSSTPLNDDNSFLVPYGIIIILIILLIVIILIIVYVMWKKRQKKRRDLYDVDGNSRTGRRAYPLSFMDNNNTEKIAAQKAAKLFHKTNGIENQGYQDTLKPKIKNEGNRNSQKNKGLVMDGPFPNDISLKRQLTTDQDSAAVATETVVEQNNHPDGLHDTSFFKNDSPSFTNHSTPTKESDMIKINLEYEPFDSESETRNGTPTEINDEKDFGGLDATMTPFYRHNSIIKDQLFKQFGLDSQGKFITSHSYDKSLTIPNEEEEEKVDSNEDV